MTFAFPFALTAPPVCLDGVGVSLRPYQQDAVEHLRGVLRHGARRVVLVAPTGAGKTVIAVHVVLEALRKNKKVLFVAHRRELLDQTATKLGSAGLATHHVSVLRGDDKRFRPTAPVQIASIDTLRARQVHLAADLVILDECHRSLSASFLALAQSYTGSVLLGLTATPWRLDGRGLAELYEHLVVAADVPTLIAQGYLVTPRVFTHPQKPDLRDVRLRGGDYDEQDLARAMDRAVLIGSVVEHWVRHAANARTLVFAASVQHSQHLAAAFVAAGIAAEHLDGTTPATERAAVLHRLHTGETRLVTNCGILTEGYDEPRVKVVVLARPTKSWTLYRQMVGRAMRPDPELPELRMCLVLDHAGCAHEHGLPQDPQDYTLQPRRRRGAGSEVPVRSCPECYAVLPGGTLTCPECGYVWPPVERRTLAEKAGELKELQASEERARMLLRRRCQAMAVASDQARGWKDGDTNRLVWKRFGKSRTEMTSAELGAVQTWLRVELPQRYPVPRIPPPRAVLMAPPRTEAQQPAPSSTAREEGYL